MRIGGFLWALWNIHGAIIRQHIVMQTPSTIARPVSIVEQALKTDPYYHERKLIRFTNDMSSIIKPQDGMVVPLSSVYHSRGHDFPRYHLYTKSHYLQFANSLYASVMEYMEFCKMEDKMAHILQNYLEDKKNHWLIMMDDPFLMGSVRGYGTKSAIIDQTTWITMENKKWNNMLIVDMGKDHPHF